MIAQLLKYSTIKLSQKTPSYKRFLYEKIDYDAKLIGLIGSRGAGKTTMILQYLKELNINSDEYMYISCEHPLVSSQSLFDIAEEFAKYGGKILAIDEIHKIKDFCIDLKNIYDFFDIQVIFTGSSAISLEQCQSDLSRRALIYRLPILSLREFIELNSDNRFDSYTLEELLNNHFEISTKILSQIKPLKYYKQYLQYGAYPFLQESQNHTISYQQRLIEIVNETLTFDLATIHNIPLSNITMLNKLLEVICKSKPYEINYETISRLTNISKNTLKQYLLYLNEASLLNSVGGIARGNKYIQKPDKIYLNNTNLFEILCNSSEIGTVRETFFVSQLKHLYNLHYPKNGDFMIDEKYIVEIGGKNKSFNQIKDIDNSFVVSDDIEIGFKNKIPLWLFGFLY